MAPLVVPFESLLPFLRPHVSKLPTRHQRATSLDSTTTCTSKLFDLQTIWCGPTLRDSTSPSSLAQTACPRRPHWKRRVASSSCARIMTSSPLVGGGATPRLERISVASETNSALARPPWHHGT